MSSEENPGEMTLWAHLHELRSCLIKSVIGILITSIISYVFWRDIWKIISLPIPKDQVQLINTAPVEAFITSIKVAIISGIIFASPWVIYNVWNFIAPGLFKNEKKTLFPVLFFSMILFLAGASFCYFVVLPFGLSFLANYTLGEISANWRQGEYASFVLKVLIAFGASFELPIISYVLTKLGVVNAKMLWSFARYAVIIIFVMSALLTPPDPITQIMLAIPLIIIYALSILVSYLVQKGKKES